MNKMIRIGGAMALLWMATGCVDEAPDYTKPIDPEMTETGYLSLADIGLYVVVDSETDQSTEASPTAMLTRAGGEEIDPTTGAVSGAEAQNNVDEYIVKICAQGAAEPAFKGTYAELKGKVNEDPEKRGLKVPVGVYDISATSNTSEKGVPVKVQARPSYAGKVSGVNVGKGQTAEVEPITCKLQNIKITVTVASDLYNVLESTPEAKVYYEELSETNEPIEWLVPSGWDWTKLQDEQVPVYFPALADEGNVLHFTFTAQVGGKTITMNREISNVMKGQWRRIHVIPKYDTTGNLTFDVTVSAFVQDETIIVGDDGSATYAMSWTEQPYVDPDDPSMAGPSIKWADGTDLPETIPAGGTTLQQVTIAAPNLIERVGLTVSTTNADFSHDASELTKTDLCAVTSNRYLTNYGIPFGDALKGKLSVSFGLDKILGQIRDYDGEYTFAFAVTDKSGFTCEQTLKFVSGGGAVPAGPTIVWGTGTLFDDEGFNFNSDGSFEEKPGAQYVVMHEGMQIDIQLAADPHFESIKVKITSDVLTEDVLAIANLSSEFDLCKLQEFVDSEGNVHTVESQATTLTSDANLGLIGKVNDELKAESAASFSITKFVEVMQGLGANAKFQFALTVVDAEGRSTTKYLRLQNPAE